MMEIYNFLFGRLFLGHPVLENCVTTMFSHGHELPGHGNGHDHELPGHGNGHGHEGFSKLVTITITITMISKTYPSV